MCKPHTLIDPQLPTHLQQAFAPLHLVALAGKIELAKMFIAAGVDMEATVKQAGEGQVLPAGVLGATALGVTAVYGKTELAKVLLDAGAVIDGPDSAPFSPLIFASTQGRLHLQTLLNTQRAKCVYTSGRAGGRVR